MQFIVVALFCFFLVYPATCSISNPHLQDAKIHKLVPDFFDVKKTDKEYTKRKPKVIESKDFSPLFINPQMCPLELRVDWEMEVNAGVVASPVIYPFFRFVIVFVLGVFWHGVFKKETIHLLSFFLFCFCSLFDVEMALSSY